MKRSMATIAHSVALCRTLGLSNEAAAGRQMRPAGQQYQCFRFLTKSFEYPKPYMPEPLPARADLGKALDAVTGRGLTMHAEFYRTGIDGRKVLGGDATLTADSVPDEFRHLITTDPASVSDAFRHMVETIRTD
jgi:hypothetical protein